MPKIETTKTETVYAAPAIAPLKVESAHVEHIGHSRKTVVVNLPPDFQISWLNEHAEKVWKQIQKDRGRALAEWDQVELRGEEFVIYASVSFADSERVTLFHVRKVSKPVRDLSTFKDANYEVRWFQGGYSVFRIRDGVRMGGASYTTPEQARSAINREYAVRA
jgi:hypothetical protein